MKRQWLMWVTAAGLIVSAGCGGESDAEKTRREEFDAKVRAKWGKGLDELETVTLTVVSPHNENIESEYEKAFDLHHALEHGQRVDIEYHDMGGSTQVLERLRNYYRDADLAGGGDYDIVWGGGEDNFMKMARESILAEMTIPQAARENIPATFGGLELYDPGSKWCGATISGFGFLYHKTRLNRQDIEPPAKWDDLAKAELYDHVALADPMKSGSAAAAYEMIVQSGKTWPAGWAKLLSILGNAKKFYDGASDAANAVYREADVATCIDFYGLMRVAKYPEDLVYVSPKGQTAYSPDPIGILRAAPHPETAQRFVDFVLSRWGQAMWALPVGAEHGPVKEPLFRQPIRKDVYQAHAGTFVDGVVNPYVAGNEMDLDIEMRKVRFGVLRQLVRAAAVDNANGLQSAKKALIDGGFPAEKVGEFNALPENVSDLGGIRTVAELLRDDTQAERIVTDWQRFFREKYERVAN